MSECLRLAQWISETSYLKLTRDTQYQLKLRLLDSIGVAVGALEYSVPQKILSFVRKNAFPLGAHLLGSVAGETCAPAHAAFYNSALVRYLDFNDSILTRYETFHPSDVIGGLLSLGDHIDARGENLLIAMAISYEIQTRMSEWYPVRALGFDHTVQLTFAAAGALGKIWGLSAEKIAHAIAIAVTSANALRVTRTGMLSHWKGLAAPYAVFHSAQSVLLADEGITGPVEVFEGNKGFQEIIGGSPGRTHFWESLDLSAVHRSILKKYNAEVHSQSTLDAVIELRTKYQLTDPSQILSVEIEIFDTAFHIIGGGEEGGKKNIVTKEDADHSLPFLVALALCEGDVMPHHYTDSYLKNQVILQLMKKVNVRPVKELSQRFPAEMPTRVKVTLVDSRQLELEKNDYEGFLTRPMSLENVRKKFDELTEPYLSIDQRNDLVDSILSFEKTNVREFMKKLRLHHVQSIRVYSGQSKRS